MCLPAAVAATAALVISSATSVMSYVSAKNNAKTQQDQQRMQSELENKRFESEALALRTKQAQDREALARDSYKVSSQAREAISTARVSATESGVSGVSVDALFSDFRRQELSYLESNLRQSQLVDQNTQSSINNGAITSQFRQTQINQPIQKPSVAALALDLAGNALNAGAYYNKLKGNTPNPDLKIPNQDGKAPTTSWINAEDTFARTFNPYGTK